MFQRMMQFMGFLGLLILTSGTAGGGQVYYVDGENGNDANGGISGWGDALATVPAAIDTATAGDEIWVKAGVYQPSDDTDRTKSFTMKDGVDLYGGFAGGEAARGARDWTHNVTILCGDIQEDGLHTNNSYHVVVGATARIDGFTVRNGYAGGSGVRLNGGGIYSVGNGLIAAHCIISNNVAVGGRGGGVYWDQGAYTTREIGWYDCLFTENATIYDGYPYYGRGSGMYLNFYTNTVGALSNCVFRSNTATNAGTFVSALYLYDTGQRDWGDNGSFQIVDTVFEQNLAATEKGCVTVERFMAPVEFRDCRFTANTNTYGVANRGAGAMTISLHAQGAGIRMNRCVFDRNYSPNGGGAVNYTGAGGADSLWSGCVFTGNLTRAIINIQNSEMGTFDSCVFDNNLTGTGSSLSLGGSVPFKALFTNCVFRANRMTGTGNGPVFGVTAPITVQDCRFEGNSGATWYPRGGGVIYWNVSGAGTGRIENCAFVTNTTQGMGGAIWLNNGSLEIRSTLFSGNTAGSYYSSIGGGAISQTGGQLLISDCMFTSNSAVGHGGAICREDYIAPIGEWNTPEPSRIERSVFIGNRQTGSSRYGGAITFSSFSNQAPVVANCLFRGNQGVRGGAIATENVQMIVSNVTAVDNASTTAGYGGALAHDSPEHDAAVVNSIFWNNSPLEIGPTNGVAVRYSNIDGGFAGEGNLNTDPLFFDETYLHLKSTTGDYRDGYFSGGAWGVSAQHSPLIDAGDPASAWTGEPRHHGERINPGAYGNTAVASESWVALGTLFLVR